MTFTPKRTPGDIKSKKTINSFTSVPCDLL